MGGLGVIKFARFSLNGADPNLSQNVWLQLFFHLSYK